ncbi:MAG: cysteine desulfurase [Ruminococcus sp.]|nr:cysteine desulfurase [Ruminococcus sp.]
MYYLDNSATTVVSENVAKTAYDIMTKSFGNPSSLHNVGYDASLILENARKVVATSIGAEEKEIFFTSGGTEANNLAIFGAVNAKRRQGNKIVTTAIEHPSVLESVKELEKQGFQVIYIKPENGEITPQQFADAIDEKTILVSAMTVNNETGLVIPTEKIPAIIKRKKSPALFHTDFVQGYGKLSCRVKKIGCDLLTVSAHKVHGPKGVGALFVKKGTRILPRAFGGMQEGKLRPGTEPLPLIGAFAKAVEDFNIEENYKRVKELNQYLKENLEDIQGIVTNSGDFPYIMNISTNCVMSQTMLSYLADNFDVCVSSGSACHKGELSHVLGAYGYDNRRINSALRISFCESNTKEDVDMFVKGLKSGLESLVKF